MIGKVTIFKCGKSEEVLKATIDFVFLPDTEHCIQCPAQEYPNSETNHCFPKVVTLAFKDAMGMLLAYTALCFCVIMCVVLWVFVKH